VPLLNFIFRTMRAIPIAPGKVDPQVKERAFEEAAKSLARGELVGIFPEGAITETGELQPFRPGLARILEQTPVPVIPMALRGLWGSFFSRKGGPAMTRPFRRGFWSRIELVAAAPVAPAAVRMEDLREQVVKLRGDWK